MRVNIPPGEGVRITRTADPEGDWLMKLIDLVVSDEGDDSTAMKDESGT